MERFLDKINIPLIFIDALAVLFGFFGLLIFNLSFHPNLANVPNIALINNFGLYFALFTVSYITGRGMAFLGGSWINLVFFVFSRNKLAIIKSRWATFLALAQRYVPVKDDKTAILMEELEERINSIDSTRDQYERINYDVIFLNSANGLLIVSGFCVSHWLFIGLLIVTLSRLGVALKRYSFRNEFARGVIRKSGKDNSNII